MSSDVFTVTMVIGDGPDAVAEMECPAHGFTIADPMRVPAGVLAGVAGVSVAGLAGLRFETSAGGWVSTDIRC